MKTPPVADSDLEDIGPLAQIPVVPAAEHFGVTSSSAKSDTPKLTNDREYRLCKAVVEHPLRPSSQYAKPAGMGPKTAITVRQALTAKSFILERPLDSSGRGRTAILLEPTPAGVNAVAQYEGKSS
ncbi:MAG: hypothetical protein GY953_29990 [bacterium]|nr:hypothetical protein [bacterium]